MRSLPLLGSFLVVSLALGACSSEAAEPASALGDSEQDLTAAWFTKNIPPGSALEKGVLALLNDRSMSEDEYEDLCNMSKASAINIVNYRNGDEPADTTDDELFETIAEADRMPFTDKGFWLAAIQCAKDHYVKKPTGAVCASGTSTVMQSPLALELVVDGSGSMTGDKWNATSSAVQALVDELATKNDTSVGLVLFDDKVETDVPLAAMSPAQAAALKAPVAGNNPPGGGTQTRDALTAGYLALEQKAPAGATKAVVLLTDGVPNGGATEQQAIVTDVTAKAATTQLFALGVGALNDPYGYEPAFMGALAVAGGTRSSATCDPTEKAIEANMCHFQVTPKAKPAATLAAEISAAFAKVRSNIAACDIGLQNSGIGKIDPKEVSVVVTDANGQKKTIAPDAVNGFSLDDATNPTKVLLRGTACADLRGAAGSTARVTLGCK